MSTYGTYRINEKKCATCSYWSGEREIRFSSNKPHTINATATSQTCIALNTNKTPGSNCLRWRLWEKID